MSKKPKKSCKFTSIGGMAVMEGIMMRGPTKTSLGVRLPSGELYVEECRYTSPREKYRVLRLPLIRGVMAFVESMLNGYKVLMRSAELAATEEERTEEQKEKDNKLFAVLSVIATILGFGLAFFLFFFCPTYIFNWIDGITAADLSAFRGLFEGIMKFALFLLYIVLVSMMKEIKRVFMFHGAEHKTIFCYEANEPLTVENCRKFSRFHPRCGTSFMVFMILIAFTNYDAAHQPPGNLFTWVGFANFGQMLFGSSRMAGTFFPVFFWTIIWAVLATFSNYIFGILFALMINKKGVRIKGVWRTIFVLTIAVPQFVSLLIMRNMLNDYGPINELLLSLGWITERIPFLTDPFLAKVSVLVVNLWLGIPYTMLITTGILMNIPEDQYEAARVDGASPLVVFFKITLPQILFVTTPYLITQFIANINNFNVIYLLTGGGPTNSEYYFAGHTDLLVTWLYKLTADRKDYSIASTIGILVFLISVIVSLITFTRSASYRKEEAFG